MPDDKGYLIPSPIDPGELTCFRVYVPKHTMYVGAFWAAYEFFTTWLAWARDPLHRGKLAAQVWRRAFDKARTEYEASGGQCEMNITGMRQNPLDPCDLQVEFDGNNQWVTVADLSKCGGGGGSLPAMRYDGVNIQIFNVCNGQWENQGDPTTPIIAPVTPPYPTSPPDGNCDAAASFGLWLNKGKNDLADSLTIQATIGTVASALAQILLIAFGMSTTFDKLIAVVLGVFAAAGQRAVAAKAIDLSDEIKCIAVRYFERTGTMTDASIEDCFRDFADIRDSYAPETDYWDAWNFCLKVLSLLSGSAIANAVRLGNVTGADCSACDWQVVFDFKYLPHLFAPGKAEEDNLWGTYQAGQGWVVESKQYQTAYYTRAVIERTFPATQINHIAVIYDCVKGIEANYGTTIQIHAPDWGGGILAETHPLINGENQALTVAGYVTPITGILVVLQVGVANGVPAGGTGRIKQIIVRGEGTNPFQYG